MAASFEESFRPAQLRTLRALKTPRGIQNYLDGLPYHIAGTAWSPRRVLEAGTAHCLEGAIFAAAALRVLGYPPLIVDLEAVNDSDHVIAAYRQDGAWGAIGSSNFSGIRHRSPVYRTVRELALSYFEDYYNLRGERTLRTFSRPVNLARFDAQNWMGTEEPLWFVAEHLVDIPHEDLITRKMAKNISRLDPRLYRAGLVGYRKS